MTTPPHMTGPCETEGFLAELATRGAKALDMEVVCIGRLSEQRDRVVGVATCIGGKLKPLTYPLAGSPCEVTVRGKAWCQATGVVGLFPEDLELVEMGASGYVGAPIRDGNGKVVALLAGLSIRPIPDPDRAICIAEAFAAGAAAELERRRLEHRSELVVRALDQSEDGVVVTRGDGSVLHANRSGAELLALLAGDEAAITAISPETIGFPEAWWAEMSRRRSCGERWAGRLDVAGGSGGDAGRVVEIRGSSRGPAGGGNGGEDVWVLRDVTGDVKRERWLARRARESFLHATISGTLQQQIPLRDRLQFVVEHVLALPELAGCSGCTVLLRGDDSGEARPFVTAGPDAARDPIPVRLLHEMSLGTQVSRIERGPAVDVVVPLTNDGRVVGALSIRMPDRAAPADAQDRSLGHLGELVALSVVNDQLGSALREAKEAAEAASRAKTRFLANMSHEIRTPMTVIVGAAERLLSPDEDWADRAHLDGVARLVADNSAHLMTLVTDMLDHSRIESGNLHLVERVVSPVEIVEGVLAGMRLRAEAKALTVRAEPSGSLPAQVRTDPNRLRQVIENIVGNAVKFTDEGSVTISLDHADRDGESRLIVAVRDTGPGIAAGDHESIFQPFSQVNASARRSHGGVGLGLSICRQLVRLLRGTVTVESELGRGSCFIIEIPVGRVEGTEKLGTVSGLPGPLDYEPLKGRRVLLAEDSPPVQHLIQFFLARAGAEVVLADNGIEAVQQWRRRSRTDRSIDLILMDMQMPRLDGYGATSMLRSLGCSTPILALTAHAMPGDDAPCLAAGCDAYEPKPITRERLLRRCVELLDEAERASRAA